MACIKISNEGHIMNQTSNKCNMSEKPPSEMACNYGDCESNYFWRTGNWSSVRVVVKFIHHSYFLSDHYSFTYNYMILYICLIFY